MFKFPDRLQAPQIIRLVMVLPILRRRRVGQSRAASLASWGLLFAALIWGGEALLDGIGDFGQILFDLVEENLEAFYIKVARLDLHRAQMATAYTYFFICLVAAVLAGRKLWLTGQRWLQRGSVLVRQQADQVRLHYQRRAHTVQVWWHSLDALNKVAVAVIGVVGAIPFLLLLSYGLGAAVAELL